MDVDTESSSSKKTGEQQCSKRSNYFRGAQRRGNFNRYKYTSQQRANNNPTEELETNNNTHYNSTSDDVTSKFSALNVHKSNNFRGSNKQPFSRHQYNSSRLTDHRNFSKDHNASSNQAPCTVEQDSPESSYASNVPNLPQRGQIIGGRYIRKQSNQSHLNSSKGYRDFQPENSYERERNYNPRYQSNSSYKYRNSNNYHSESHEHTKKEETYGRHASDSSSEYSVHHNLPYQSREVKKRYTDSHSHKYQNYGSSSEEAANYKTNKFFKHKPSQNKSQNNDEDKATQRELLISRLNKAECECLVCCELIRTKDQIWHCLSCYHVLHLWCIKKWARSPAAAVEGGSWRCPACQSLYSDIPFSYLCFCGKSKNPEINYHLTPHTCGEICDRIRPDCSHHCKELCHPGPCPPCAVFVLKSCPCGKTTQTLPCNQNMESVCESLCDKVLNCGAHRCRSLCHDGKCLPCEEVVIQKCYCGKNEQSVACTIHTSSCSVYSCGDVCNKELDCGHHTCPVVCHPGPCESCKMSVETIKYCCCGQTTIDQLISAGRTQKRTSCQDPVPVCGLNCRKKLFCGPKDNPHVCQSLCHEGSCPSCPLTTSIKCNCGAFTKEFPCAEITESFVYKCEKRCNRRKDCSRHKCLNTCCTSMEHKCELVCNKKLSCGLHQCQEICHMGNCPTCWNVSFDELRCHCGTSVLYPPIHCGTKPPECSQPCIRSHPCDHEVKHSCHSDENCPPCTSLTTKWCYGKHKQCGPVMCFLDGISCGMPCQKPLPCGRHKCKLTCHGDECLKDVEKCTQPCMIARPSCGHPCNNPCHDGPCPETPCKAQVTSSCPCGHRSETTTCFDSSKSYHLMSSTMLATKMQEIKEGQSVNLSDVLGKKSKNNKLQCNEECAVIERNKRLAVALQIQNPDLSCSPGPPSYSEFLKDEAKKNPQFVADVYDKLTNLVQLAKQSKQKCRSHSFPPMNRDQRRIVHELAEFFGCETQSYDEEPKRNVVVTAYKNKCWLPFINIMSVVQRDMGMRKGPAPVLVQRDIKSASGASGSANTTQKKKIDYFDYNE